MTPARRTLTLLALLAACGGGSAGHGDRATAPLVPTSRDSAGVTILEHPADALERAPLITIDSVPMATFASSIDDAEHDLSRVSFVRFLASGDVLGYDFSAKELVVLRVAEEQQQRMGRAGAGPNEIGGFNATVLFAGDTFAFGDQSNDRLALGTADSGIVRTIARAEVAGLRNTSLLGRMGDSLYLLSGSFAGAFDRKDGPANAERSLVTWREGEDSARTRAAIPGGWMVWKVRQFNSTTGPVIASTAYGLPFATMATLGKWGDGFLVARGEQWALEQWDTAGRLVRVMRINQRATAVTDSIFERYVAADAAEMAAYLKDPDLDSIRTSIRERGHADSVASYARVETSPNGTMWVIDYQMSSDSGWAATAVASDGRILGRIVEAHGELPQAFGDDRLLFKTEDENGLATWTVRRLHFNTGE